jgi:TolB protein
MLAFESNRDGNWEIYVADADGTRQRRITRHEGADRNPAWSPSGEEVVFARTFGEETSRSALLFPHWSPSGDEIAFTRRTRDVFQLEAVTIDGTKTRTILEGSRDLWPRWSPDGRRLAFFSRREAHAEDDEIYIADGAEIRRITQRSGHDFCPAWSPDGRSLVVAVAGEAPGPAIAVIALDGTIRRLLGQGFAAATEPSRSKDGRIAYAARDRDGYAIYVE